MASRNGRGNRGRARGRGRGRGRGQNQDAAIMANVQEPGEFIPQPYLAPNTPPVPEHMPAAGWRQPILPHHGVEQSNPDTVYLPSGTTAAPLQQATEYAPTLGLNEFNVADWGNPVGAFGDEDDEQEHSEPNPFDADINMDPYATLHPSANSNAAEYLGHPIASSSHTSTSENISPRDDNNSHYNHYISGNPIQRSHSFPQQNQPALYAYNNHHDPSTTQSRMAPFPPPNIALPTTGAGSLPSNTIRADPYVLQQRLNDETHTVTSSHSDTLATRTRKSTTRAPEPYILDARARASTTSVGGKSRQSVLSVTPSLSTSIGEFMAGYMSGTTSQASSAVASSSTRLVGHHAKTVAYAIRFHVIDLLKQYAWPSLEKKDLMVTEALSLGNQRSRRQGATEDTEMTTSIRKKIRHSGALFRNNLKERFKGKIGNYGIFPDPEHWATKNMSEEEKVAFTRAKVAELRQGQQFMHVGLDAEGREAYFTSETFLDFTVEFYYGPDGPAEHSMHNFYPKFPIPALSLTGLIADVVFRAHSSGVYQKIKLDKFEEEYDRYHNKYRDQYHDAKYHHRYITSTLKEIARRGKAMVDARKGRVLIIDDVGKDVDFTLVREGTPDEISDEDFIL